jgi:hypothetical protein
VIIVEKGEAAALGFDDVFLVVDAAPDVGSGKAGFFCDVDELDGRSSGRTPEGRNRSGSFEEKRAAPPPERGDESFEERAAENN